MLSNKGRYVPLNGDLSKKHDKPIGRVFGVGHALMNMGEKETWGIVTKRSRVWAMKRGTID